MEDEIDALRADMLAAQEAKQTTHLFLVPVHGTTLAKALGRNGLLVRFQVRQPNLDKEGVVPVLFGAEELDSEGEALEERQLLRVPRAAALAELVPPLRWRSVALRGIAAQHQPGGSDQSEAVTIYRTISQRSVVYRAEQSDQCALELGRRFSIEAPIAASALAGLELDKQVTLHSPHERTAGPKSRIARERLYEPGHCPIQHQISLVIRARFFLTQRRRANSMLLSRVKVLLAIMHRLE